MASVFNIPSKTVAAVHIEILDVNDNKPIFVNSTYKFQILENSPYQSFVGKVKAIDNDSKTFGRISYSMKDPFNKYTNL